MLQQQSSLSPANCFHNFNDLLVSLPVCLGLFGKFFFVLTASCLGKSCLAESCPGFEHL